MASNQDDNLAEGRIDLVPMIDCIMILLLFFIMTTKFTSEEKAISSILPTDKGQTATTPQKPVEPPQQVNVCIYPGGMTKGFQPSEYQKQYVALLSSHRNIIPTGALRVGNRDPRILDVNILSIPTGEQLKREVEEVHAYIRDELEKFEIAGDRKTQNPIVLHCFSGMSWRFALVVYDAIRSYETIKSGGKKPTGDPRELENAREVSFAPPRVRDYSVKEQGEELFEIIHMK